MRWEAVGGTHPSQGQGEVMGLYRARPKRRKEHWETGRQRETQSKNEAERV